MPAARHVVVQRFAGTPAHLTDAALNVALKLRPGLKPPLLVKGEPGTGKTSLAEATAETPSLDLLRWPVKSTAPRAGRIVCL